jgi:general secretion pathway protein G
MKPEVISEIDLLVKTELKPAVSPSEGKTQGLPLTGRMRAAFVRLGARLEPTRGIRRTEAGLSLLEIMIVLALLGLIAGTIGVAVFSRFKKGQVEVAKQGVMQIAQAVEEYQAFNQGACPTLEELESEKLVKKGNKDPWGKPFKMTCPPENDPNEVVDVVSFGPDRQEGTEDDILSWEL